MNLENESVVLNDVAETATSTALTNGQKVAIIAGASVLTAGLACAVYFGIRFFKRRHDAKKAQQSSEDHE